MCLSFDTSPSPQNGVAIRGKRCSPTKVGPQALLKDIKEIFIYTIPNSVCTTFSIRILLHSEIR